MALMDRAVGRELWGPFAVALAAFYGVLLLGLSGFELVRQAVALGLPASLVLKTMAWRSPEALGYALPVATLAASLSAYARLASQGEAVAWRALGVGPWRLAWPALGFGAGITCLAALCFALAPAGAHAARTAWAQARPLPALGQGEAVALSEREGGELKRMAWVRPEADGLSQVLVAELEGGRVVRLIQAKRAQREAGAWLFQEGWQAELGPDGVRGTARFARLRQGLPAAAEALGAEALPMEEQGFGAAWDRLAARQAAGLWGPQERAQAVLLHQRLALPAVSVAFALGGVAAGLAGAKPGVGRGLGGTALAVFGFYLLMFGASSAGAAGWLGPAWAAWAPTLVAAGLGAAALARAARG